VEALSEHHCVSYRLGSGRIAEWEFCVDGKPRKIAPKGKSSFNDVDLVLRAVLDGQGIAQLPDYQVAEALQSGQLTTCIAPYAPAERGHYLCYLSREHIPARARVYIDYMTAHTRTPLESSTSIIHDVTARRMAAR